MRQDRAGRRLGATSLAALLASGLAGCQPENAVMVELRPAAPITNVTAYSGADKTSWPALEPGRAVSATLDPKDADPELTLTYTVGGEQRDWRGTPLRKGAGHRVRILIGPSGDVTGESHCTAPCSLPD